MLSFQVSYAQNGDDILLARALSHIKNGFYIDIGAWDPEIDSVSKLFYDQGWCGINIEPHPGSFKEFKLKRQRDKNLECALGEHAGRATLTIFPGTGWHTLYPSKVGMQADLETEEIEVEVRTLSEVLRSIEVKDIHWLKIDAEGAEFSIIKGIDFNVVRPWIIVIEATLPNSATKAENLWTANLLKSNYIFCLFDGLNEFWVSQEHSELRNLLSYPAGVHDNFIRNIDYKIRVELESTMELVETLQKKLQIQQNRRAKRIKNLILTVSSIASRLLKKYIRLGDSNVRTL